MSHWEAEGRVDRLKELHKEGHSCQTIANMLGGGISRSAVIGKLHRLGLGGTQKQRLPDGRVRHRARSPRAPRKPNRPPWALPGPHANILHGSFPAYEAACVAKEKPLPPGVKPVTILNLENRHCRWPIGDPGLPDFRFCGDTKVPGHAYCEPHLWRATDRPVRVVRSPLEAPGEPVHNGVPAAAVSRVAEPA